MILRRSSGANNLLAQHVESFCNRAPVVIGGLRAEWVPQTKQKSSRLSFGELDHQVIGDTLARLGFISQTTGWTTLTEAERNQILQDKGLGGQAGFVEAKPRKKRGEAA